MTKFTNLASVVEVVVELLRSLIGIDSFDSAGRCSLAIAGPSHCSLKAGVRLNIKKYRKK